MTDAVEDVVAAAELKPTPTMDPGEASNISKPPAETTAESDTHHNVSTNQSPPDQSIPQDPTTTPQLSKSQLKKLKKKEEWEAKRDDRKVKRRVKAKARKERRRANPETYSAWQQTKRSAAAHAAQIPVPVSIVFDCSYDDLMNETELVSLCSQLTRAYSDSRKSVWRPKMVVSSFGGKLRERFETVLYRTHEHWKGVEFLEGDFVEAADRAVELRGNVGEAWRGCIALSGETGTVEGSATGGLVESVKEENDVIDVKKEEYALVEVKKEAGGTNGNSSPPNPSHTAPSQLPPTHPSQDIMPGETIYLSSDSPNILTSLKPNSTYIIGALVDKNRHKGACYKAACSANVKTAKLPIREFMQMTSRQVLATSHVGEIMLKWLEYGDWGRAFMEVIPTRKGGVLRDDGSGKEKGKGKDGKDRKANEANGDRRGVEDCVVGDDDDEDGDEEEDDDDDDDGEDDQDEDMMDNDRREEDHGEGESKKRKPPDPMQDDIAESPKAKRVHI